MARIDLRTTSDKAPISFQCRGEIIISTEGRSLVEFTDRLGAWVEGTGISDGVVMLFVRHTSASLLIQENADPSVCDDLLTAFARFAPDGDEIYRHRSEGPDDMPAHIRSALTQTHLSVPLRSGRLALGTWQGLYLFEHRLQPHNRTILIDVQGH